MLCVLRGTHRGHVHALHCRDCPSYRMLGVASIAGLHAKHMPKAPQD